MSSFGDRVRRRRLSAQLRQTDFAQFGITQSQLSMIENDTIEPSAEKIEKIAAILKVTALELVAGTKLEDVYLPARFTDDERAAIAQAAHFSRSQRLVAVQESYSRVARFFELLRSAPAAYTASIEDEAQYQQTLRIVQRTIDAAREYEATLAGGIYLPPSMIDEPAAWSARVWIMVRRSAALIASLIVEFPEADDSALRREVVLSLGLERIDACLETFQRLCGAARIQRAIG